MLQKKHRDKAAGLFHRSPETGLKPVPCFQMPLHEEEEEEDSKLASNRSDLEELDQDTGMWERARALSKSWASGESEKKAQA